MEGFGGHGARVRKRARKRHIDHKPLLYRIAKLQGFACVICGEQMQFGTHPNDPMRASIEHVIPRSLGGREHDNRLATHKGCNTDKGNALPSGCELIWLAYVNAKLDETFSAPR